jgi:hypothetical protein
MAQKTKIKKDKFGLYVLCGGWISRPLFGTCFSENEQVKTHHFGGSVYGGVTVLDKPVTHNFKRDGRYETWVSSEYKEMSDEEMKEKIDWYTNNTKWLSDHYEGSNKNFVR